MNSNSSNPIRVLLVDDEVAILNSLQRELGEYELDVDTASSATEAEAILSQQEIDVIVCDYKMPGRTGLELLSDVKMRNPDMITIVLSGQVCGISVAEDWAKEIGVHAMFAKPIDASLLADRIQSEVQAKRSASCQKIWIRGFRQIFSAWGLPGGWRSIETQSQLVTPAPSRTLRWTIAASGQQYP